MVDKSAGDPEGSERQGCQMLVKAEHEIYFSGCGTDAAGGHRG